MGFIILKLISHKHLYNSQAILLKLSWRGGGFPLYVHIKQLGTNKQYLSVEGKHLVCEQTYNQSMKNKLIKFNVTCRNAVMLCMQHKQFA